MWNKLLTTSNIKKFLSRSIGQGPYVVKAGNGLIGPLGIVKKEKEQLKFLHFPKTRKVVVIN